MCVPDDVDLIFPSHFFSGDEKALGCLGCYFALFEIQISGMNILLRI